MVPHVSHTGIESGIKPLLKMFLLFRQMTDFCKTNIGKAEF
jgi:hypothetical protein